MAEANHTVAVAARFVEQGNWPAAVEAWEAAAQRFALLNRQADQALALHNLAWALRQSGRLTEALGPLQEAARINESLGLTIPWWRDQVSLLQLAGALQDWEGLRRLWEKLEPRSREVTDAATRALFLNERGLWQVAQGDPATAIQTFQEALVLFEPLRDYSGQGAAQANLAWAWEEQGNPPAALAAWRAALRAYETAGDPYGIAFSLAGQGRILAIQGKDLEQARDLLERAARNFEQLGATHEAAAIREQLKDSGDFRR